MLNIENGFFNCVTLKGLRTPKTTVSPGQKVKIIAKEGLTLIVEPIKVENESA